MEGTGQSATPGANGGASEAIELGATLKEMRVALKRDLDDVADELRIRRSYLEAIEEGRFSDLPGTTYALGFVRAYAETLGFDAGDAARRFKAATAGGTPQANLILPAPVPSGGLPTGAVLLTAATLAVLAYGGWYVLTTEGRDPGAMVASLPGKVAEVVRGALPDRDAETTPQPPVTRAELPPSATQAPVSGAAPDAAAPSTTSMPPRPLSATDAAIASEGSQDETGEEEEDTPPPPPEQVVDEPPPPIAATPAPPRAVTTPGATAPVAAASAPPRAVTPPAAAAPVAAAPAPRPAPAPAPAVVTPAPTPRPAAPPQQAALPPSPAAASASSTHRIVLVAHADSWVELRDSAGAAVYSRVLRKDDRYEVPERQGLVMMTGNAGGVEVLVDGRAAPALGALGSVKRNIVMDPDRLREGTAVPPPPPPQPATPTP